MEAANQIQDELRSLAEQMASEPFFKQFDLSHGTLAQINLLIEQRESIADASNPEPEAIKESYRRFKASFCLFLMQLESSAPLTDERLNTLTLAQYLSAPAEETAPEKTVMGQIFNFMDHAAKKEVSWEPEAPSPAPQPAFEPEAAKPSSRAATELFQAAQYMRSIRLSEHPPISAQQVIRIESQQLCFSIEAELQEAFSKRKELIWNERKPLVSSLFISPKWEFQPAFENYLQSLVDQSELWKKSERLPMLTFKNVLRLSDQSDEERFASTALEQGLWILLFGQDFEDASTRFTNKLRVPSEAQCGEIFLRLCRVNRLKTSIQNALTTVTAEECNELWGHAEALFAFVSQWNTRQGGE